MSMATRFLLLYIFSIILCFCKQSLSPQRWATISRTDTNETAFSLPQTSPTFNLPSSLSYNGTIPIVAYYQHEIHIVDTFNNVTYYTNTQQLNDWAVTTDKEIPFVPSYTSFFKYPNGTALEVTYFFDGACITFKCYTQIDEFLYILYDFAPYIITFDLSKREFSTTSIPTKYAGYYCLTNNGSHIFAIGGFVNILIISDLASSSVTVQYSADYIANDADAPSTCSMDNSQENIYIINNFAIFKYSLSNDLLSVIYDRDYYFPYNRSHINGSVISADATDQNIIWIQAPDQYIYALSAETDKFLTCRVDGTSIKNPHSLNALVYAGGYVFKMGGLDVTNSIAAVSMGEGSISYEWDPDFIDSISLIETQFTDHRFVIADWYHPFYPLGINYTEGLAEFGDVTDGYIQIELTSLDFDVENIFINIFSSETAANDNECRVCGDGDYDNFDVAFCSNAYVSCLEGLSTDLWAIKDGFIPLVNEDNLIDVAQFSYSIEAASTAATVPNSADPSFVCNSFPIYPVYLAINISLTSHAFVDKFYFVVDYEYRCNGCSVADFNDEFYAFSSSITIESEALGVRAMTMDIVNQRNCTITENGIGYECQNYSLETLSELYFDGEYAISLSSSDTFLESNEILLGLSPEDTLCRVGSGYAGGTNSCHLCLDGFFSMRSDLRPCKNCSGLDGVTCEGSNSVTVSFRYWLSGYRQSTDEYITLFEMNNNSISDVSNDDILVSHICGYGQCCDEIDGCGYSENFYKNALCSNNRDITSAMCTACIADNYELLSTNDCGECVYYDNMYYLIGIFALAFFLVLYLSFCDAKPLDIMLHTIRHRNDPFTATQTPEADDDYESESDDIYGTKKQREKEKEKQNETEMQFSYFVADSYVANSVLIFQIFVYYFQGYAEILNTSGSRAYLAPIVNFFNFNFADDQVGSNGNNDSNAGFCAIPYTTALSEIFMILIFPFLMVFSLFLIYGFCHQGRCCRGNKYCTKPYVAIAFGRIGIIIIGLIFRVLLQLITCTHFVHHDGERKWVHFYFEGDCFGASWSVSLVIMIILFLFFVSIYKKLYLQLDEQRYSTMNGYSKLVQAYKNEYWYWEAVITLRRFLITMFVTLSFIGGGYSNLVLCLLLIFFLIAHLALYPFQHIRNNRIEAFCILAILIGFIGINFDDIANSLFLSLFLGIVIFTPVVVALYYFVKLCYHCYQFVDGNDSYWQKNGNDKLELMMTRVLHKRPSHFEKKGEKVDLETQPYATPGDGQTYNIEMAALPPVNTQDGNHSDSVSSCGLNEN